MSSTAAPPWRPSQDLAARVRDAAVASLTAYGILDAGRIEAERIDNVATGDMPRIVVFADETADSKSPAGTAPAFDVTIHLIVQALVERATKQDAIAQLDALIAQVKDGLLEDPEWVALTDAIHSVRTQRSYKHETERIIGDGRVQIDCVAKNILYRPRVTQPLKKITVTVAVPATTT